MVKSGSAERHPFTSLLLLLLLMFAGAFAFTIIGFALSMAIYGLQPVLSFSTGGAGSIPVIRFIQIFSSIGMFVVPPVFFAKLEGRSWVEYLKLRKVPVVLFILMILIMFSSGPVMEWGSELNKSMKLPAFLKDVEEWMMLKEQELAEMTRRLLKMDSIGSLSINLLMLAVIPAIGEEFVFRGCLQKLFAKWTGNKYAAIWITAIIFSAIHVQFYGFIPRMLLGALFGYLLVWSGSLWIPIGAHFLNNSVAVITAYSYQQKGISLDKLDQADPQSWLVYLISFLACGILLWTFYTISLKYGAGGSERTDGSRLD
jgi:membrane protease YdiL (CAAX protease family)